MGMTRVQNDRNRKRQKEEHVGHSNSHTCDLNHRGFSSKIHKGVYLMAHLRSRLRHETQKVHFIFKECFNTNAPGIIYLGAQQTSS